MDTNLQLITIVRMSNSSDAIGYLPDGKICFVSGALPGDTVEASVFLQSKKFARATVSSVVNPSPYRIQPECSLEEMLTGCPWAIIFYDAQLRFKHQNVVDCFKKFSDIKDERIQSIIKPTIPSPKTWNYRNKLELSCKKPPNQRPVIGMTKPGTDDIVKLTSSHLLPKKNENMPKHIAGALSYLSGSHGIEFERVTLRISERTKDVEVGIWTKPSSFPRSHVAKVIRDAVRPTSLVRVIYKGTLKERKISQVEACFGAGNWSETVNSMTMKVSAPSFFQVNTKAAEILYQQVLEFLQPTQTDIAMDLYCGAGTFTLPLATQVEYVQAVESFGPAVRDLRRNIQLNNLDNIEAIGGDASYQFPDEDADIIVVDPPRAGLAKSVIEKLSTQNARAIAYVSCDPATLARDIAYFHTLSSYEVQCVQPVDLFPQTHHIECVALLQKHRSKLF